MKTITKEVVINTTVKVATVEDFTNFMEENRMLYKFLDHCYKCPTVTMLESEGRERCFQTNTDEPLIDFLKFQKKIYKNKNCFYNIIQDSFIWNCTPEGWNEWSDLDQSWRNWLKDNDIEDFEI